MKPAEALRHVIGAEAFAAIDEAVVEYMEGVLDDIEGADDVTESLGPLLVDAGCLGDDGDDDGAVEALCLRVYEALVGAEAKDAPGGGDAAAGSGAAAAGSSAGAGAVAADTVLAAPIRLASRIATEEAAVQQAIKAELYAQVNINEIKQIYTNSMIDDGQEMSLKQRLKREKKLLKMEKRLARKERVAAVERDAILARLTNTPVVMHPSAGSEFGKGARDMILRDVTMSLGSLQMLDGANFTFVAGRRYGLVGRNGVGKTTLLKHIAAHAFEGIPRNLQILHIEQEVEGDEDTVLQSVLECDVEREGLLEDEKELLAEEGDSDEKNARLKEIYERLDEIDAESAPSRAATILFGLGFTEDMQQRATNTFSGGWRMRIALARALFIDPEVLLLDEPTNHLDLHAVLWLEEYLQGWENTLIVVSHARDFLNAVVTDIVHFFDKDLTRYKGDYDNYEEQRAETLKHLERRQESESKRREHVQKFIDRFRYNAKRAKMVQSRIKHLEKMATTTFTLDSSFSFNFPNPESLSAPLIQIAEVAFGYSPERTLFRNVNLSVDMESRIALVGPNGAGKSTLLKLVVGGLEATEGTVLRNGKMRLGYFSQHFVDQLEMNLNPLDMFKANFPDHPLPQLRAHLGSMGVSGNMALQPIRTLSGGQKARVALAKMSYTKPHVMLLDEPTNHLDLDTVEALIMAISQFDGGILIVSHDEHLISTACDEMWIVEGGRVQKFEGDFQTYKKQFKAALAKKDVGKKKRS